MAIDSVSIGGAQMMSRRFELENAGHDRPARQIRGRGVPFGANASLACYGATDIGARSAMQVVIREEQGRCALQ
jgi:hypothetical protein